PERTRPRLREARGDVRRAPARRRELVGAPRGARPRGRPPRAKGARARVRDRAARRRAHGARRGKGVGGRRLARDAARRRGARANPRPSHLDLRPARRERDRSRAEARRGGAARRGGIWARMARARRILLVAALTLALAGGSAGGATRTYSTGPLDYPIPDVG